MINLAHFCSDRFSLAPHLARLHVFWLCSAKQSGNKFEPENDKFLSGWQQPAQLTNMNTEGSVGHTYYSLTTISKSDNPFLHCSFPSLLYWSNLTCKKLDITLKVESRTQGFHFSILFDLWIFESSWQLFFLNILYLCT